ncbi:MAG: hypothetical protein R2712_19475 [Vicinamibacterales bacterium]
MISALWNGQDIPPATPDSGNTVKLLRTAAVGCGSAMPRQRDGQIRTAAGQAMTRGGIRRVGPRDRWARQHGDAEAVGRHGHLFGSARLSVQGSTVTLSAASVHVQASLLKCDGVIQGTTLIVDSVVASSYTPGAGNLW